VSRVIIAIPIGGTFAGGAQGEEQRIVGPQGVHDNFVFSITLSSFPFILKSIEAPAELKTM